MPRALGVILAVVASSACYSPQLRDCTVSCSVTSDCAGDQVCGRDRLCAMPAVADHCAALSVIDAGVGADAAIDARIDAGSDAAIDAAVDAPPPPPLITLHVQITDGKGAVEVDGHGACASQGPQHGDCTFLIAAKLAETVRAMPDPGQKFLGWTSTTCQEPAACTFTPTAAVTVSVAFAKLGGDGGDDDQP
jgi:hypothetical protein